jgi:hypothetical protein
MLDSDQPEILSNLVAKLVKNAYHELESRDIRTSWAKLNSYAEVRWRDDRSPITIKCDESVADWHDAALTGLLAHELSHPAQRFHNASEYQTDTDVIMRGLGVYLAFERVSTGRYDDHLVNRRRDRYLGYETIRRQINDFKKKQLDKLMEQRMLKPHKPKLAYDSVVVDDYLSIGGFVFEGVTISQDTDIKYVIRDSITYIYADDRLIGQLNVEL